VAVGLVLWAGSASAIEIVLGPADQLALDQPRVTFGLTDESTDPPSLIGPAFYNSALLDTGANGVLLASLAYYFGEDYGQPLFNGSPAQYEELGVAGSTMLDVHDLHALRISDSANVERLINPSLRAFGSDTLNIGSYAAILGMPAMTGYAIEIDLRPNLSLDFQGVYFHDSASDAVFESASTLNVDMRIIDPEYTDMTLPEALRPTFAGLPVFDHVNMFHTGGANSGGGTESALDYTFLMDTGAQTVIISQSMAADMGIDFSNTLANGGDIVDFLEVGGIGGTVNMPLVVVDKLVLPAQGGIELAWTDLIVGVLDIDGAPFDAVFGMNMLTTGYLNAVFGTGGSNDSLINTGFDDKDLVISLINDGTILTLDDLIDTAFTFSRDDFDLLVDSEILPDTSNLVDVYNAVYDLDAEFNSLGGLGDPLFDKVVFDFTPTDGTAVMRLDFAQAIEVPEPGTLMLMAAAGTVLCWRRRNRA